MTGRAFVPLTLPEQAKGLRAVHGLLLLGLLTLPLFVPYLRIWPLYLLVPLALYFLVVFLVPPLRRTMSRARRGRLSGSILLLILAISLMSAALLVLWSQLFPGDFRDLRAQVPLREAAVSLPLLGLAVLLYALLEEVAWRSIILDALAAQVGLVWALFLHALAFGLSHWFFLSPPEASVALSFLYGLILGGLWWLAEGLAAPVLAHILTDAAIAVLVFSR